MSKRICIRPTIVQQLRNDFKSGKLNFGKLAMMSDSELRQYWKDTYGFSDELSSLLTSEIQKAVLSPKRAEALKRVLRKTVLQRGNLYSGVSIENAQKLAEKYTIQQLADMSREDRIKALTPYMLNENSAKKDKIKTARDIAKRMEQYAKEGRLEESEKRLFGTSSLQAEKRAKGKLAEIERLGEMGLLTPENAKSFMRSYVESRLGVAVEPKEAKKLYKLTKNYEKANKELGGRTVITGGKDKAKVKKQIDALVNYSIAQKELIDYTNTLKNGKSARGLADELIQNSANLLLGSLRSFVNSLKYQIVPSAVRFGAKRVTSGLFANDIVNNLSSVDSIKLSSTDEYDIDLKNFVTNQIKAGMAVYDATGLDIARSTSATDDTQLFSFNIAESAPILFDKKREAQRKQNLKERRQKELENSKNPKLTKLKQYTIDRVVNFTSLFPKWFAGTTDTYVSNATKADTILLWSDQISKKEEKQGKLPSGMTQKQRRNQLVMDAYSLGTPSDPVARIIKAAAIQDAHYSNNTQDSMFAKWILKRRRTIDELGSELTGGRVTNLGKVITPFARISATGIGERIKSTSLLPYTAFVMYKYNKIQNSDTLSTEEKIKQKRDLMTAYSGYVGAFTLALGMFFAQGIKKKDEPEDDVDYIPSYPLMDKNKKGKLYALSRVANATTGSVKIFGTWYKLSDLDIVGLPLLALNEAYQSYRQDGDIGDMIANYALSNVYAFLDAPGIKEAKDYLDKATNAISTKKLEKIIDGLGFSGEAIVRSAALHTLGAWLGRDVLNAFWPPKSKYDFLGNEITLSRSGDISKDIIYYYTSTSHVENMDILTEYTRLGNNGKFPTVDDPDGKSAKALQEVMSPEDYTEFLQTVKQEYARQVRELIVSDKYKKMTNEDKKKAIDEIRKKLMFNKGNEFEAKLKEIQRTNR